jgi:hypothetical protein
MSERIDRDDPEISSLNDEIDRLNSKLSAARELGPCGLHPKMFWVEHDNGLVGESGIAWSSVEGGPKSGNCSLCDREKAAIAAALRQVVFELDKRSFPITRDDMSEACVEMIDVQQVCKELATDHSAALLRDERARADCGHPKACWVSDMPLNTRQYRGDGVEEVCGHCAWCADLARERACAEKEVKGTLFDELMDTRATLARERARLDEVRKVVNTLVKNDVQSELLAILDRKESQ